MENKIILFEETEIRRVWFKDEWHYSLVDIVLVLTNSKSPAEYFKKIRQRDKELDFYVGTNCPYVNLKGKTGKNRKGLVGNSKDIFRLVQSLPSKKAEPFKLWLAQVGYDRLEEIENPVFCHQFIHTQ